MHNNKLNIYLSPSKVCNRYPCALRLAGLTQHRIRSLPNKHDLHWESNPVPSDLLGPMPYPCSTYLATCYYILAVIWIIYQYQIQNNTTSGCCLTTFLVSRACKKVFTLKFRSVIHKKPSASVLLLM